MAEEPPALGAEEAKSLESWAHLHPIILKTGRTTHMAPVGMPEAEHEEYLAKLAEEDKVKNYAGKTFRFRTLKAISLKCYNSVTSKCYNSVRFCLNTAVTYNSINFGRKLTMNYKNVEQLQTINKNN